MAESAYFLMPIVKREMKSSFATLNPARSEVSGVD